MAQIETHAVGVAQLPLVDLNRERREERRAILRHSRRHVAVIVASVALAVVVPLPLTLQALTLHRECQKAQQQASGVQQRLKSVTEAGSDMDVKIARWSRLVQSQQIRQTWSILLPALAACLPSGVSLQHVQISQKDDGPQIQILGTAGSMADLRGFTSALANSPFFAQMHLNETTAATGGLSFQMEGPVNAPLASDSAAS